MQTKHVVRVHITFHMFQEGEAGTEVPDTTTDSGVSSLPISDSSNEESQGPNEKAPVRFGWVTGVMVSNILNLQTAKHLCHKYNEDTELLFCIVVDSLYAEYLGSHIVPPPVVDHFPGRHL